MLYDRPRLYTVEARQKGTYVHHADISMLKVSQDPLPEISRIVLEVPNKRCQIHWSQKFDH